MNNESGFTTCGVEFKDATTYSKDDKVRKPTAWEAEIGKCRIYITNNHRDHRPNWIFHCFELGYNTHCLGIGTSASKDDAAFGALDKCYQRITHQYNAWSEKLKL